MTATQLPLRLSPHEILKLDNFYFSQGELSHALNKFCTTEGVDFIYLWGAEATGKSHLLMACTEQLQQAGHQVIYLSLAELMLTAEPEVLASIEQVDYLCFDDIDAIAGFAEWEEALFHCFNRLRSGQGKLLVAANDSPANVTFSLADLRSRMATALIYQLSLLTDEAKQQALQLQAHSRGLILPDEVALYLLRHHGRDMKTLITVLQQLDRASLAAKRRLTIPFVSQTLANG